jgi:hypothetical protein
VRALLVSLLAEQDVTLPRAALDALVARTFAAEDANGDGVIDLAEFASMVAKRPGMLRPLTLSVAELLTGASSST